MILYLNYMNNLFFFQFSKIKSTPILKLELVKRLKLYSKKKKP